MAQVHEHPAPWGQWLRIAAWTVAATLLLAPLIAMQFTREVVWTPFDFALAAALLFGSLGIMELAIRRSGSLPFRAGIATTLFGIVSLIVVNGAVGIVGSEDDPANLMFVAVPLIGFGVVATRRFRRGIWPIALATMATAQVIVGAIALVGRVAIAGDIVGATIGFAAIWLTAATLFARANR